MNWAQHNWASSKCLLRSLWLGPIIMDRSMIFFLFFGQWRRRDVFCNMWNHASWVARKPSYDWSTRYLPWSTVNKCEIVCVPFIMSSFWANITSLYLFKGLDETNGSVKKRISIIWEVISLNKSKCVLNVYFMQNSLKDY